MMYTLVGSLPYILIIICIGLLTYIFSSPDTFLRNFGIGVGLYVVLGILNYYIGNITV